MLDLTPRPEPIDNLKALLQHVGGGEVVVMCTFLRNLPKEAKVVDS
jgi:hypothetical protein